MLKRPENLGIIHFIGIGGIGMSGIAEVLVQSGYLVQGSDIKASNNTKRLEKLGIEVFIGQRKSNIFNAKIIVVSTAISKNNIELVEAKKIFLPIVHRAEMLGELMRLKQSIAIAGTHGKTTTTSLIAKMIEENGMDPIIINGGITSTDQIKDHLTKVDGVMIGRAAYENPFLIKDIDSQIYGEPEDTKSKKIILNKYLDYVEEKLDQGHDLSRMMKHLFGLSRGDKFAKTFRIKILEVIKKESLGQHRKELEDLLIY